MNKTIALLLLIATSSRAETIDQVQVISVYDGDTFKVNIPGVPAILGKGIPVRVFGIDTPEMKSKVPCEQQLAKSAKALSTKLLTGQKVTLLNVRRDKYFRILADVMVNGVLLRQELIDAGLAHSYFGRTKAPWKCDL